MAVTILGLLPRSWRFCAWFLCLAALGDQANAQPERLELGKRLQRFEKAWELAPLENRLASTPPMQEAVQSFFGLQLQQALRKLDDAWSATTEKPLLPWQEAALGYRLQTSKVISSRVPSQPASEETLRVQLTQAYEREASMLGDPMVHWELLSETGVKVSLRDASWKESLEGLDISLGENAVGDYWLQAILERENHRFPLLPVRLSIIENFPSRLAALEAFYDSLKEAKEPNSAGNATLRSTVGEHLIWLRSLNKGNRLEIEHAASKLLDFCEAIAKNPENFGAIVVEMGSKQDVWLNLSRQRRSVCVRLRVPPNHDQPLPVLFLFHGAGGSENMFFETYGAGRAVEEGLKRNWLVIAPRQGFTGPALDCTGMLDLLSEIFPIDRSRVSLVGHSMGAGQVLRQTALQPNAFCAIAAIGGGARVAQPASLAPLPCFIAAGELDFGKRGAMALKEQLQSADAKKMEYREYKGIEHMVIVQAAMHDLFAFLDQHVPSTASGR